MQEALDTQRWVPIADANWQSQMAPFLEGLRGRRICVLSGAGCSTASGIPDYRGEGTAKRARNPIQFRQFVADEAGRRRYWARSMRGWPRFVSATPSAAHWAIADLERRGRVVGVITQNVDRLHGLAGSKRVVELHGALADVMCLDCGQVEARAALQRRLVDLNPGFLARAVDLAPDGDADLEATDLRDFVVPRCSDCSGVLKPNVVFFGEGVKKSVVDDALSLLGEADALLIAGSSLTVFSGFRFVRRAVRDHIPVFVANIGVTRADQLAAHVVRGRIGDVLTELVRDAST